MSHLCPHKQNPVACLTCFMAPKIKVAPKTVPQATSPSSGKQTILDRVKERGAPAPLPPVPPPAYARPAPKNPHDTRPASMGEEPLMEFPKHPSIIDRQPRRGDA